MEQGINDMIWDFSKDIRNKYDEMLIKACAKKGLVMSVETANQYRVLEILNKDYCIIEHVPTGTKICSYDKNPTYTQTGNKMIAEWGFREL